MVLLWNKKMMSPDTVDGPVSGADTFYENASDEQVLIDGYADNIPTNANSLTLNLTNYLSDFDAVAGSLLYRISEKESKGAENLANGKPRYYPAAYIEAMKETVAEEESDEPVDPPTDPAT